MSDPRHPDYLGRESQGFWLNDGRLDEHSTLEKLELATLEMQLPDSGTVPVPFTASSVRGDGWPPVFTPQEGSGPYTTSRQTTVQRLHALLHDKGWLLIKAPPESGKACLLRCFLRHLAGIQNHKAVYINMSAEGGKLDIDAIVQEKCGHSVSELIAAGASITVMIDRAHKLFKNMETFEVLKLLEPGNHGPHHPHGVRIILSATHGPKPRLHAGSSSPDSEHPSQTPIDLYDKSRLVTILEPEGDGVSLRLDKETEWAELWQSFLAGKPELKLGYMVQDYIYTICAGQVGLISRCLCRLSLMPVKDLRKPEDVNANALYTLTSNGFIASLFYVRSLRKTHSTLLKQAAMHFIRQLLWVPRMLVPKYLEGSEEFRAIRRLYRYGHVVLTRDVAPGCDRLEFPSPLHRAFFFHMVYTARIPAPMPDSILDLLKQIIERMDPLVFQEAAGFGTRSSTLEHVYQAEINRSTTSLLPKAIIMSCEVEHVHGAKGFCDFFLPSPYHMALEITREGSSITEHLGRFLDPTKYEPLVDAGVVRHHAVVDMRSPAPGVHKPQISSPSLYSVCFSAGFQTAEIWHMGYLEGTATLAGSAGEQAIAALKAVLPVVTCD